MWYWEHDKQNGVYRHYYQADKKAQREYDRTIVTPSPYGKGFAVFKQGQMIVVGLKLNEAKKY